LLVVFVCCLFVCFVEEEVLLWICVVHSDLTLCCVVL